MHLGTENKKCHGLSILYCLPISTLFCYSPSNRGSSVRKSVGNSSAHPLDSHLSEFKPSFKSAFWPLFFWPLFSSCLRWFAGTCTRIGKKKPREPRSRKWTQKRRDEGWRERGGWPGAGLERRTPRLEPGHQALPEESPRTKLQWYIG